ncbi:MAG: hypothetical protein ACM3MF_00390, partial [Anaerolineae bacterium]
MAQTIICPVCGETNPADMEFCHNCQSRLRPLPGSLQNESAPIQPGELPTKKATGELEPLLPQWLRDARQKARENTAEDASASDRDEQEPAAPPEPDLLAGLASQRDDDEEDIPEWLANITGATRKKKKPAQEESQVKWVELGHESQESPYGEPSKEERPGRDELTDWFKQAASESGTADFRMTPLPPETGPSTAVPSEPVQEPGGYVEQPNEDLSWLHSLDAAAPAPAPDETPPAREEVPEWLKRLQAEQTPPPPTPAAPQAPSGPSADVPDWLRQIGTESTAPAEPEPSVQKPLPEASLPDWIKDLQPATPTDSTSEPAAEDLFIPTEVPDWLASLEGNPEAPAPPQNEQPSITPEELPASPFAADWLSALDAGSEMPPARAETPSQEEPAEQPMVPDWLSSLPETPEQAGLAAGSEAKAEEPAVPAELPDWMAALQPKEEQPSEPQADEEAAIPTDVPDWLAELGTPAQPSSAEAPTSPLLSEEHDQAAAQLDAEEPAAPGAAFPPEAMPESDVDSVFASMQMPDWLSAVLPTTPAGEEDAPAAAQEEEPIGPAELPSWVQAMRPVESVMDAATGGEEDALTEKRGPLAGLRGVLPTIPGAVVPSSKPKPHSMKLDATEQQLAHAALLEQILAAETSPVPMKSGNVLGS